MLLGENHPNQQHNFICHNVHLQQYLMFLNQAIMFLNQAFMFWNQAYISRNQVSVIGVYLGTKLL